MHNGHLGRVKVAQVKARQISTVTKHISHIGHLAGVQVLHARDGLKALHFIKPAVGGRRAGISKRGVKDNFGHIDIELWSH